MGVRNSCLNSPHSKPAVNRVNKVNRVRAHPIARSPLTAGIQSIVTGECGRCLYSPHSKPAVNEVYGVPLHRTFPFRIHGAQKIWGRCRSYTDPGDEMTKEPGHLGLNRATKPPRRLDARPSVRRIDNNTTAPLHPSSLHPCYLAASTIASWSALIVWRDEPSAAARVRLPSASSWIVANRLPSASRASVRMLASRSK